MPLTGPEAANLDLVVSTGGVSSRPASIDLRVGCIIIKGKEYRTSVKIKPQQMFILVSNERVKVRAGLVGYAMPKTSLCKEGILCLNTGIVDPGYDGLISTTAINFDQDSFTIAPGDPFLRLVFHRLRGAGATGLAEPGLSTSDSAYIKEAKSNSKEFPGTFLDIPGQIETITKKVLGRQTAVLMLVLTIFTVLFAAWNLGGYLLLTRQAQSLQAIAPREARSELQLELEVDSVRSSLRDLRGSVCAELATNYRPNAAASSRVTLRKTAGCP